MDSNKSVASISFKEIFKIFTDKWYIYTAIVAICLIVAIINTVFFTTPLYSSSGKLYILNKDQHTISSSNISVSSYLAKDYENLIKDKAVLNEVVEKTGNKYSYGYLRSSISVDNPDNTRFIEISITTPSAADSKEIIDALCEISKEKIETLLGIDGVSIIRKGDMPTAPANKSFANEATFALIVGVFISLVLVLINYFFNDKISSSEDIERYLDLTVLGNIPHHKRPDAKAKQYKKYKKYAYK